VTTKRDHLPNVRGLLTGEGLNIPDGDIYAGARHEGHADDVITMTEQGGVSALDTFGAGGEKIQRPVVQVLIRHTARDKGKSDADDAWGLIGDMDLADYSPPTMRGSGPIYLGKDTDGRHEWSINVELYICE